MIGQDQSDRDAAQTIELRNAGRFFAHDVALRAAISRTMSPEYRMSPVMRPPWRRGLVTGGYSGESVIDDRPSYDQDE